MRPATVAQRNRQPRDAEPGDGRREPPSEEEPARSLADLRRRVDDLVDVIGNSRHGRVLEPDGEVALEAIEPAHAVCPSSIGPASPSDPAASAARSAASARPRRDCAVPSGTPSVSAIAGTESPT